MMGLGKWAGCGCGKEDGDVERLSGRGARLGDRGRLRRELDREGYGVGE